MDAPALVPDEPETLVGRLRGVHLEMVGGPDAAEFLHLAAVACLTEVAVESARTEVEHNLHGSSPRRAPRRRADRA